MKCAICGKGFEDGIAKIISDEVVHEECYEKYLEEKMKEEVIVDAEAVDITEGDTEDRPQPKCEVIVGMEANGNLYFLARGEDPSLLNIEGLIKFAQLKMEQIWATRMSPQAPTEAESELEK